MSEIKNNYCKNCGDSLNDTYKYFFAAVVKTCYEYVRFSYQDFIDSFEGFYVSNGKAEAFCRLIIISRIEHECRLRCNDVKKQHINVIREDGDISDQVNDEVLKHLWLFLWKENNNFYQLYDVFNNLFYEKNDVKSVYWQVRNTTITQRRY